MATPAIHDRESPRHGIDEQSRLAGLRAVASFEAIKGVAVLLLALGLLKLLHKDVEEALENLLFRLHINPDWRLSHELLRAARGVTDRRLWTIAGGALAYALVRFTEAWGLWNRRVWAEWFAIISGALYVPWELVALLRHLNWQHGAVLLINLIILFYLASVRLRAYRAEHG